VNSTLWAIVCRQFPLLSTSVPVLVTITTSTATRIWHRRCIDCSCWFFGHVYNFTDERVNERVNTVIHSLYYMYFVVKLPYRAILSVTIRQREVQRNAQWPSAQSCVFRAAKNIHTKNKTAIYQAGARTRETTAPPLVTERPARRSADAYLRRARREHNENDNNNNDL